MKPLLNAGSGKPLGADLLHWIKSWGFHGVRQDIPLGAPANYVHELIHEVATYNMVGCFIVGGWAYWEKLGGGGRVEMHKEAPDTELAAEQAAIVASMMDASNCEGYVYIGNEPDITDHMSEKRFVGLCQESLNAIRAVSPYRKVVMGGVHNIKPRQRIADELLEP